MRRLEFEVRPEWTLARGGDEERLQELFDLLAAIASEGNLSRACARRAMSYRHAWELVRRGAEMVGAPLVDARRGQQARLTALGEKLVWANQRAFERLAPLMQNAASELESEVRQSVAGARAPLRVQATYAFVVVALLALLQKQRAPQRISYVSSREALGALASGACDVAGFPVPLGGLEAEAMETYGRWLHPQEHSLIQLVVRRQGLIVARGNPLGIGSVADLARPRLRFVNRQPGSGTRMLLEMQLRRAGVSAADIRGFDNAELTHGAVAAYVASGMADAGPGTERAARRFNLGFVPLFNERYFLACRTAALEAGPVSDLLAAVRSPEFRFRLSEIQGIDILECGSVRTAAETFASNPIVDIQRSQA